MAANVWGFAQAGKLNDSSAAALHKDILFIIQRGQQQPGLRKTRCYQQPFSSTIPELIWSDKFYQLSCFKVISRQSIYWTEHKYVLTLLLILV